MNIFLAILILIAGFALLIKGADWLVYGASSLARRIGVSELTVGLTIVAFGTSLPELTVNIFSSFSGATDIAIGNIVGSNIANILLILGICALIAPLAVQTSTVWKEIPFAILAAVVLFTMANDAMLDNASASVLSRSDGFTIIGFFIIFLWYIFNMQGVEEPTEVFTSHSTAVASWLILIGLLFLIVGGKLVVEGAVSIAEAIGISQAFIGLTIVAVGTSLPELATSSVAAYKGKADIAVGNIVGSNIFNIFWILGVSSIIRPLIFNPAFNVDLLVSILAVIVLFVAVHNGQIHRRIFLFWKQRKDHIINRIEGLILLLLYAAYIAYIGWRG